MLGKLRQRERWRDGERERHIGVLYGACASRTHRVTTQRGREKGERERQTERRRNRAREAGGAPRDDVLGELRGQARAGHAAARRVAHALPRARRGASELSNSTDTAVTVYTFQV